MRLVVGRVGVAVVEQHTAHAIVEVLAIKHVAVVRDLTFVSTAKVERISLVGRSRIARHVGDNASW